MQIEADQYPGTSIQLTTGIWPFSWTILPGGHEIRTGEASQCPEEPSTPLGQGAEWEPKGSAQGQRHKAKATDVDRSGPQGRSPEDPAAGQLGHFTAELELRVYAHAMRDEESDLSFAEFGGSKRLYPAPGEEAPRNETTGAELRDQDRWENLERETGFEPATLSLGS